MSHVDSAKSNAGCPPCPLPLRTGREMMHCLTQDGSAHTFACSTVGGRSLLVLRRLAKSGHVGDVLRSSRSELVGNQVLARNERRCQTSLRINHRLNPVWPGMFEVNAVDLRQDIYREGARPMRKNLPRSVKSTGLSPSSGAPNSSSEA